MGFQKEHINNIPDDKKFRHKSKHSEATRKKMSESAKARHARGEHPMLGKAFSQESRLKMSLSKKGKTLSSETKIKLSNCKKGKLHWNYKHDRTLLSKKQERSDSAYKEWRISVYKRDTFTCKINNENCNGRIEAHHILGWTEFPELRYEIRNGITLCHAHHPRKRAEEKRLANYFNELVSVSKELIWH